MTLADKPPSDAGAPTDAAASPAPAHQVQNLVVSVRSALDAIAEKARAKIAEIKLRMTTAARNYYDLARGLVELEELAEQGAAKALGHSTFRKLCTAELGMSPSTSRKLVRIGRMMTAELYSRIGSDRADALLDLVAAVPNADPKVVLAGGATALWKGAPPFDVATATTTEIRKAAARARARANKTSSRGRTVSRDERALAEELSTALSHRGVGGDVAVTATNPGQPARFAVTSMTSVAVRALIVALQASTRLGGNALRSRRK